MTKIEYLLAVLAEECSEVAHRALKAQRFGFKQIQVDQPYTNAQRITHELNDVYAVVELLRDAIRENDAPSYFGQRVPKLIEDKKHRVLEYMRAQSDDEVALLDRHGPSKSSWNTCHHAGCLRDAQVITPAGAFCHDHEPIGAFKS